MRKQGLWIIGMVGIWAIFGPVGAVAQSSLKLTKTADLTGFLVPECVVVVTKDGSFYISNIEAAKGQYWTNDGKGFISRIDAAGKRTARWVNSSKQKPLHGPKGMCVLNGLLFFNDNSRLMSCNLKTGKNLRIVADGFKHANDLATDGISVWLSDTEDGSVWCISPDGSSKRKIPSPASINGLTFHGAELYGVSWGLHEVYRLDPQGKKAPEALGLAITL